MAWKVPLVDPQPHYRNWKSETDAPFTECLAKGDLAGRVDGRGWERGRSMEMGERHDLAVVEDAWQSLSGSDGGKQAGSFGLGGWWSFYPFKILGGFGDGGAVTTDDAGIVRM